MVGQSVRGSGSVVAAAAFVVIAVAVFGAVFYFFDGAGVVSGLISSLGGPPNVASQPEQAAATDTLSLPDGMSEEFALQVWQEQMRSQRALRPLAEGEVRTLRITDVTVDGDTAMIAGTLAFTDGTSAPGYIGMHRFDGTWYMSFVSASPTTTEDLEHGSEPPKASEVDIVLLNTVIAEQEESGAVTEDIVEGRIREIRVGRVNPGPNTATIPLTMVGDSGKTSAELIAIETESRGEGFWFLARLDESGTNTQ